MSRVPPFCAFVGLSSDSSAATIGLSDIAPMVKVIHSYNDEYGL